MTGKKANILWDHEELKDDKQVVELMNYMCNHEFNKVHIESIVTTDSITSRVNWLLMKVLLILSCLDNKFVICSSNAALILNKNGVNFNDMNLRGIFLKDTDLSEGNFIRTNLEYSRMRRVKLTSADFSEANLTGIDWEDMEAKEV